MATASIRAIVPGLIRSIVALALAVVMVGAALVGPASHAHAEGVAPASIGIALDEGAAGDHGPSSGACHAGHACPGCGGAALLGTAEILGACDVSLADLRPGDETSPPTPARLPPVEPPRG